jgi:outer membrane receptor for ferrienterochelin and colicins
MNKRIILLQVQPVLALRSFICALVLLAVSARAADNSTGQGNASSNSGVSQSAVGTGANSGTNQASDLTQMSLEQLMQLQVPVVETASKFEQKATEAPADSTVITSNEIKKYGWRTLGDLLASVPGFYVSYDRNYDYVGVSGVNLGDANNRILLLVNGHRINNDLNDSAAIDNSFILDVDLIDRVEIIRGPGSVLYGNNAFFAVINVITRQGKDINGVEGSGTYGSYNEGSGRVTVGGQFTNSLQFLLSGTIYNNPGPENLYFPEYDQPGNNFNNGIAHNMNAENFQSFFGSVGYKDLTLEGGYINRAIINPTAQYDTEFNNPAFQTIDDRSYTVLKFSHNFEDDWSVSADAYYDRSYNQTTLPFLYPAPPPPTITELEQLTGQWAGMEAQVNKKIFDKDTITFGGEYRNDFDQAGNVYENGTLVETVSTNRQNYGIFGQGDFAILDSLRVNAGVRYDEYGGYPSEWSPRVALIYNPWKESTFKAIYGTAFRDPNVLETASSAGLDPEKIYSYQLVYEQGINQYLRSSVLGYYNHMDNLIGLQSDGSFGNFNADTLGLEPSLEAKWKEVSARLSYSLQRTENRQTGVGLPNSPENMIKLNVSAPLYRDKLFAGLEVQYYSQSSTLYYNYVTPSATPVVAGPNSPGYAIVNFTLFSQNLFIKNLQLSASIYNLLDTKYYEPSSNYHLEPYIQQNGINFRLKVTYSF